MEFQSLLEDLRRGNKEAATLIYQEYASLILRIVRRHLSVPIRARADSDDFTQEVWLSFVKTPPNDITFESPAKLAAYLAQIARNRVIDAARRCIVLQRSNISRERPIERAPEVMGSLADRHSSPSETAMRNELQAQLLSRLQPAHRKIGALIFAGNDVSLIAQECKLSPRTVERVRQRLLEELQ
jgi:RNA polymerase sigma factor (sigma-70 family)